MKLKDRIIEMGIKDYFYDKYERIVYDNIDYDDIELEEMADEIIEMYHKDKYLFGICTIEELKVLKEIYKNKLNKDINYSWELIQLQEKLIINDKYEIYDELIDVVDRTLKIKITKKIENNKRLLMFIIGLIKTNGSMLFVALKSMISSISTAEEGQIEDILSTPLIHFYCDYDYMYIESLGNDEREYYYRDYVDILDDINEERERYSVASGMKFYPDEFIEMFYYGMPIYDDKLKNLYDKIITLDKGRKAEYILENIDHARLFNKPDYLDISLRDIKIKDEIKDALKYIPSAALNSFTPEAYYEEMKENEVLDVKFTHVKQNDAHLPKKGAQQFYKIYFALLEYTNNKYKINENLKRIYKQEELDVRELRGINDYLWDNKSILDEFIASNPYKFNKEDLDIVDGFKSALKLDYLAVVGFERNYTKMFSRDGKMYMVKGINDNLDKILKNRVLPVFISTTLLMFKGNIIYNSFLCEAQIDFGNDIKRLLIEEMNEAIEYYHL